MPDTSDTWECYQVHFKKRMLEKVLTLFCVFAAKKKRTTRVVWCGVVWCGVVWYGMVWYGMVWYGMIWCGVFTSVSV